MKLLQRFLVYINRFPTWAKIFTTIMAASLMPVLVLVVILGTGIDRINQDNITAYLRDVVSEHQEGLTNAIVEANNALESISNNVLYKNQILALISNPEESAIRRSLENMMTNRLIDAGLFSDVRIVNLRGRIIIDTDNTPVDTDVSRSDEGYRAGINAQLVGNRSDRVVYADDGQPRMDVVSLIFNNESLLVGYLIGTVNDDILLENLEGHNTFIPVYSYIVSRNGYVFTPEEFRERAERSVNTSPVERALFGQTGVDRYTVGDTAVTAAYTAVAGNEFALITETLQNTSLVPPITQIIVSNIPFFIILIGFSIALTLAVMYTINAPIRMLREAINRMVLGDFDTTISTADRSDEIGTLSRDLIDLREQLRLTLEDQERRLALRTRNIRATQEISRFAATQRNAQILMDEVVNLIINLFPNIYHAQVFLLDDDNNYAVLRASTGKPGRQLLARGHRLQRGSVSVIGQVTAQGRTIAATDTVSSDVHRKNEFLPDTRSELAIPLRIGDRIIGALDVQSRESNTFTEDQITILETMADQIAISLDSARLYQESIRRLQEIDRNRSTSLHDAWQDYLYDQRTQRLTVQSGYETEDHEDLRQRAITQGTTQIGQKTDRRTIPFAVPIRLRGTILGAVQWEVQAAEFSQGQVQLAEELVNRLAITLENARLFEQSQRTAQRERVVNDIAGKLTGKTDINEILQTAVREVGQALRAPEVNIRLNLNQPSETTNGSSGTPTNGHKE